MKAAYRKVPFFPYPDVFGDHEEKYLDIIRDVAGRGAYILQRELAAFEQHLAEYVGAKHVLGMANATDALHFAVRAAGIGVGDEVIFASHTMTATAAAIHFAGATPVPVECGEDHLIDPESVRAAITPRTKAIMPTQLNGRVADMDTLGAIAHQHGLVIIEDAAQALGARFRGRCAGTFGLAGCISFYPAKTLGCFGDGGCLVINDDELFTKVKCLRDHGRDELGQVLMWGLNSRLDNVQAAILDFKLQSYDAAISRRRTIAATYQAELGDAEGLRLPPPPADDADHFDIFQNYEIESDDRDGLRTWLSDRGVGTLIPWGGKAVHQHENLGFDQKLPRTEQLFERVLMLPMNTSLTDEEVSHVCRCVRQFVAQSDRRTQAA